MKTTIKPASISVDYSSFNPVVLEEEGRLKIARQIYGILRKSLDRKSLKGLNVLDLGAASGVISNYLATFFKEVHGIDVDEKALKIAKDNFNKKNLKFYKMNVMNLKFSNESFDVVICNQVYECVENQEKLMLEIFRTLKPGGICFLGARNKYTLWDGQYHLPLLAFMPQRFADWFVRVMGRSDRFHNYYLSFWGLLKLCSGFKIEKVTPKILNNPKKYRFRKLVRFQFVLNLIPVWIWRILEPILPNFIWVLRKATQ